MPSPAFIPTRADTFAQLNILPALSSALSKRDIVTLELTRDQVKAAPEYKDKQSVVVLGAAGGLQSMPDW